MIPFLISPDCVALLFPDGELPDLRKAVAACLSGAGCPLWPDMEAELYSLPGRQLLIARPRPPLRERIVGPFPRLRR